VPESRIMERQVRTSVVRKAPKRLFVPNGTYGKPNANRVRR
jgi:hypothetical protein